MKEREKFILRVNEGTENIKSLCAQFGISRKTGYKWLSRLRRNGIEGFKEHSRAPRHLGRSLDEKTVCRLVALKHSHETWGPKKIHALYERMHGPERVPSLSSVKRVLTRSGLVQERRQRRVCPTGALPVRVKATRANAIWTIDFKGWWTDREGSKCQPLTVRDAYSRYLLCVERLEPANTAKVKQVFIRLFKEYGQPEVIHSDNGTPFAHVRALHGLGALAVWLLAQGIQLSRSRPGCPQDNAGHERMHRDIALEVESRRRGSQAELDYWREEFNQERPHEALGQRPPAQYYEKSSRAYLGIEQMCYESMSARRVSANGAIRVQAKSYYLSTALRGWDVGLKTNMEGNIEVWFAHLHLGDILAQTDSFKAGVPPL